ncbi:MAG: signal peptidase II, partial [Verrucomicrobiae bacterium]|nr:signal peptidase II [Verrucomicrobiae bacterium]
MTAIAIAIIGLDQFTKHWVNARIRLHESRELIENFFHFTHVRNSGAAWGIFRQFPIALAILGGLALAILIVFGPFFQGKMRWTRWGWACLVGGIAGNLIDRL